MSKPLSVEEQLKRIKKIMGNDVPKSYWLMGDRNKIYMARNTIQKMGGRFDWTLKRYKFTDILGTSPIHKFFNDDDMWLEEMK